MKAIKLFLQEEEGVTMVEYGLMAALIAVVCIAAVTTIGIELDKVFDKIADALTAANGGSGTPTP